MNSAAPIWDSQRSFTNRRLDCRLNNRLLVSMMVLMQLTPWPWSSLHAVTATTPTMISDCDTVSRVAIQCASGAPPNAFVPRLMLDEPIASLRPASSSPTRLTDATYFTVTATGGTNVTYQWDFGDGTPTRAGASVTHTYAEIGHYTALLTASNGVGSVTASTMVHVTNSPPTANAGPDQSVKVGELVILTGGGSDVDGHMPLAYRWKQIGGLPVALSNSVSPTPSFIAPSKPDILTFTLTVTDSAGLTTPLLDAVVVAVSDVPINGLMASSSTPMALGQTTLFTATINGGTNVSYQWNFGDGHAGDGSSVTHLYRSVGNYTVIVTATNGAGTASADTSVVILYLPVSGLTMDASSSNSAVGDTLVFTASVAMGTNVTYYWDFGDGTTTTGASLVTHTYTAPGIYTATVTATNAENSMTVQTTVKIGLNFSRHLYLPTVASPN